MSIKENNQFINLKDLVFVVALSVVASVLLMLSMAVFGNVFGPQKGYITSFLMPIIPGIIYYLIISKSQKIGVQFIFVTPIALVLSLTMSPLLISLFVIGIINEIIMLNGGYKSKIRPIIPYVLYSTCLAVSGGVMLFLAQDRFLKNTMTRLNLDEQTARAMLDAVKAMYTFPHFLMIAMGGILGAILGYYLGKKMLYKHFKPAGIVK